MEFGDEKVFKRYQNDLEEDGWQNHSVDGSPSHTLVSTQLILPLAFGQVFGSRL